MNKSQLESSKTKVEGKMQRQEEIKFDEISIARNNFADHLEKITKTLKEHHSLELENLLEKGIEDINREIEKLREGKIRFLIIGDFNRGKSTILNLLLGENLLPVSPITCTSIVTEIKYGKEQKVIIHNKNGTTTSLSIEKFKDKYTADSEVVKTEIETNPIYKNSPINSSEKLSSYFSEYNYAELECPSDVLKNKVEFIDSPGLNSSEKEDKKTFDYIDKCDVVFFVLSAKEQVTSTESKYLKRIRGTRPNIFYLINFWNEIPDNDQELIRNEFRRKLGESLDIESSKIEKMWNEKIFEINIDFEDGRNHKKPVAGKDFSNFTTAINRFLLEERLKSELMPSARTVTRIFQSVSNCTKVIRNNIDKTQEEIDEKIKLTEPHFEQMGDKVVLLKDEIIQRRDRFVQDVQKSYINLGEELVHKFDNEFKLDEVTSLDEKDRQSYIKETVNKFQQFEKAILDPWIDETQTSLQETLKSLEKRTELELKTYNQSLAKIQEILQENSSRNIELNESSGEKEVFVSPPSPASSKNLDGNQNPLGAFVGPIFGSLVLGGGASVATVGASILSLGLLAITPIGWSLIAGSVFSGIILGTWNSRMEYGKFKNQVKDGLKKELEKNDSIENLDLTLIKIKDSFEVFEQIAQQMDDHIKSLKQSLNNILMLKKQKIEDLSPEKANLESLEKNLQGLSEEMLSLK